MASESPSIIRAHAILLGSRLDTRKLRDFEVVASRPLTVAFSESGKAVFLRFGVVVTFDATAEEESGLINLVLPYVDGRLDPPEDEYLEIQVQPDAPDRFDSSGWLVMKAPTVHHLQVIAYILAKSTVLSYYEKRVATVFDRLEVLTHALSKGRLPAHRRALLKQISDSLLIQAHTVGRAEVTEKSELTWDRSDLDRLYEHLANEYELRDRDIALSRKLALLTDTAETYLNLLHSRLNIRLEWYIVILIVIEIILFAYDLSIR